MSRLTLVLCLVVSACSTMPPQVVVLPTPPELLMRPPLPLKPLPPPLSITTPPATKLQSN